MKRVFAILILLVSAARAIAQDTAPAKSFLDDPFNDPMLPIYVVSVFVFVVVILVCFVAIYMIRILNMLTRQAEKEQAAKTGKVYVPKPSWWLRFSQTVNASVPVEEEKNIELDHSYDGIRELDNHLPPWWKWLFYGTIGWSAVYLFVFHISGSLPLSLDEYSQEVAIAEEQARKLKASQPQQEIDENTLAFSRDSVALIANGRTVFKDNNCGSCHRADGGGNSIGPNLTDEYWLHGGDVKSIFGTIKKGVVEKGMPAWSRALTPQQVRDVTFFVLSLRGSKPENAKAPQGTVYKEVDLKSDSTKVQASL